MQPADPGTILDWPNCGVQCGLLETDGPNGKLMGSTSGFFLSPHLAQTLGSHLLHLRLSPTRVAIWGWQMHRRQTGNRRHFYRVSNKVGKSGVPKEESLAPAAAGKPVAIVALVPDPATQGWYRRQTGGGPAGSYAGDRRSSGGLMLRTP